MTKYPEVVPGEPPFVAPVVGRELHVDEVDDRGRRGRAQVLRAVGDAGRDAHQARVAVAEHEALHESLGRRALAHVGRDQGQLVGGRHVPHVGLALVQVEGLDRQRLHRAVVDLKAMEALQPLHQPVVQARELGHRAAVVVEALELHDLEPLDRAPGLVVLDGVPLLGCIAELRGRAGLGRFAGLRRFGVLRHGVGSWVRAREPSSPLRKALLRLRAPRRCGVARRKAVLGGQEGRLRRLSVARLASSQRALHRDEPFSTAC